jgi:cytochrome P450
MSQQIPITGPQSEPTRELLNARFPGPMRLIQASGDVGRFTAGRLTLVAINSAELTRLALGTHADAFEPGSASQSFEGQLLSNGIVVKAIRAQGSRSVRCRRAFARTMRAHAGVAAAFAERLCARRRDGDAVGTPNDVVQLARWMVTRCVFELDDMPDAADEIASALTAYATAARKNAPMPPTTRWAIRRNRQYRKAIRQLRAAIRRAVAQLRDSGSIDDGHVIAGLEQGFGRTDSASANRELSARLTGVLMLSVETAMTVMNMVWSELVASPRVWIRMYEEVDAVLAGRTPQYRDLRRLRYVGNVVREVLRLQPPVTMFSRRLARDLQLGDHHIPAGAIVVFNPHAVHRSADCFPNPGAFDPDRFAGRHRALAPYSYMPFGAGEHSGVHRYALSLTHIVLATIVQRLTAKPNRLASTMARARPRRPPRHSDRLRTRTRLTGERPCTI